MQVLGKRLIVEPKGGQLKSTNLIIPEAFEGKVKHGEVIIQGMKATIPVGATVYYIKDHTAELKVDEKDCVILDQESVYGYEERS